MKRLLLRFRDNPPDALFAGSDAMAIGAMGAIHDAAFRIPHDIAVGGVDDIGLASSVRPSITGYPSLRTEEAATCAFGRSVVNRYV